MARERARSTIRRPRLRGVDVDSERIRQARLESGLSLAQVAGGDLTRAAIHLVENGRSRPSMPTLELIAARTGKDVSYFLKGAVSQPVGQVGEQIVCDLESECEREEFERVIESAAQALPGIQDRRLSARLHLVLARAFARTLRGDRALEHAEAGNQAFADLGDRWMVAECLGWKAAALLLLDDPGAIEVAQEALDRCRELTPRPYPTESRILSHLGGIHLSRSDWNAAIKAYQEAIEAAGPVHDLGRRALMYEGMSIAYAELGDTGRSRSYQQRALGLRSVIQDEAALARAEVNMGLALVRQGDLAAAGPPLERARARLSTLTDRTDLNMHLAIARSEFELASARFRSAGEQARIALELAQDLRDHFTAAAAHQILGRLAAAEADPAGVAREFSASLALLARLNAPETLIECHSNFARALEELGDTQGALEQWKHALAVTRPHVVGGHTRRDQGRQLTG